MVYTKYKTVDKMVKPAPKPLPANNKQKRKEVSEVREYWTARGTSVKGKASSKVLPKRWATLEEVKEAGWTTSTSSQNFRSEKENFVGISLIRFGWTL